ncbi:capsular exopolysaccharide synthesis family protein [Sphingomonas zeicaulis]|uniref:GumC family protein n=1 Tax=Sphingomonas zeicaulis TaxID=1632740 RepID=UPI003D21CD32
MNDSTFPDRRDGNGGHAVRPRDDGYQAYVADYDEQDQGFRLNIGALIGILRRNWIPVAVIVALALIAGLVATLLATKIYRSAASVQIEQQTAKIVDTQMVEPATSIADANRFLNTQLAILQSRGLAIRTAERMKLFDNSNFLVAMGVKVDAAQSNTPEAIRQRREMVIGLLRTNTSVELPTNSRVAQLRFDSPDPRLSAQIANGIADAYVTGNLERKFDTSAYARDYLAGQLAEQKQRLEDSERAMIAYARESDLVTVGGAGGATGGDSNGGEGASKPQSLTSAALVDLNTAYTAARAERIKAEQRWRAAQRAPLMSLPEVIDNGAVQALIGQRATLRSELQQQRRRHKADHPEVIQLNAQIAELDSQISRQATDIRDSIRETYQLAVGQEQQFDTTVGQLRSTALEEQGRQVRLNILQREVDTNRELYNGLLQRFKELSATAGVESNNVSIIDRAEPSFAPIKPRPLINMAIALAIGFGLAALFVFARENLDDAIRTPDDVQRMLNVPALGAVPLLKAGENPFEEISNPRSAMAEAYQSIRTALELSTAHGVPRSLVFTSSRPSEGKSTSATATAQNLARTGKRALLVDADLRLPTLHKFLDLKNNAGFVSLLTGQKTVMDVRQPTGLEGFDFISSGPLPPAPAELLSEVSLNRFLNDALAHYDVVVIDAPPVMGFADAPLIAAITEGTVFVVEADVAHRGAARTAIRRLVSSRANVVGAILTKFDAPALGYYNYNYSYSYEYGNRANAG